MGGLQNTPRRGENLLASLCAAARAAAGVRVVSIDDMLCTIQQPSSWIPRWVP